MTPGGSSSSIDENVNKQLLDEMKKVNKQLAKIGPLPVFQIKVERLTKDQRQVLKKNLEKLEEKERQEEKDRRKRMYMHSKSLLFTKIFTISKY